jgi:glutathione S-transferase
MSHNARKARMVAHHLGLPVDATALSMAEKAHKTPDFLALNPNGQVPVLQTEAGTVWESGAVALTLAYGSALCPSDALGMGQVVQWMLWQSSHLGSHVVTLHVERYFKRIRGIAPNTERAAVADAALRNAYGLLDAHLSDRDWLVGDRLSVADFVLAGDFTQAENAALPLDDFPHLRRWLDGIRALPAWTETAPPQLG